MRRLRRPVSNMPPRDIIVYVKDGKKRKELLPAATLAPPDWEPSTDWGRERKAAREAARAELEGR